jgi:hypothetical protein
VESVFSAALDAHEWLANTVFCAISPLLATHAVRPSAARVTVRPADDLAGLGGWPTVDWWIDPLPWSATSTVEIELARRDEPGMDWKDDGRWRAYEQARPHAAAFGGTTRHSSVLEVFGSTPATDLAYELLRDDLRALRWMR